MPSHRRNRHLTLALGTLCGLLAGAWIASMFFAATFESRNMVLLGLKNGSFFLSWFHQWPATQPWMRLESHPPGAVYWLPTIVRNWAFTVIRVPLWIPLSVILLLWLLARRKRPTPGHCVKCGYDLTGNRSGRCPECGTAAMRRKPTVP